MPKRTVSYRETLLRDLLDLVEVCEYLTAAREDSPEMLATAVRDVVEAHQLDSGTER